MGARHQSELTRVFDAPRDLIWAIVADTNRWDRAAGLAAPSYRWGRDGERVLRHATASELGLELAWVEPPYNWIEGEFVEGARVFTKGPPTGGGFRVTLAGEAPQVRVHAVAWVEGPAWVGWLQRMKFSRALVRYFDAIEFVLRGRGGEVASEDSAPAVVRARAVLSTSFDPVTSGARTPADEEQLARRAAALERMPVDTLLAARLTTWLRTRPDEEVAQLRPFELARLWGVNRRSLLRVFLHATRAGLTDLSWQVNCPVCRVAARLDAELGALDGKAHCAACEIDYEVDFAQHIEAVFPINPAVRPVSPQLYCASSPAFLPHVFAQLRLAPDESRTANVTLPPGPLHLRTLWTRRTASVDVGAARPAVLRVRITGDSIVVTEEGQSPRSGPTALTVENETDREAVILLERSAWNADQVLGTVIASMPEFGDLFATEAPAAGMELRVGHIALLFSDLTGSTALYEREGDARAFALVEEHFRAVRSIVEANGGAVVKTMGDAVMASFASTEDAVDAALAVIQTHDETFRGRGIGVKVGVHGGACLAVRANERLDYFGGAVNIAARLQAQAAPSEVVLMRGLAAQPRVSRAIAPHARRDFEANLKGIAGTQELVGVRVGGADEAP